VSKEEFKDQMWLTPYNQAEWRSEFKIPEKVRIHDVTIREVMQSPRRCLNPDEKIRVARQLDKLGVYSIENGAYMTDREAEVTAELVKMNKRGEIKAKIVPLAHWVEEDIDTALKTGADRVLMSASGNPWYVENLDGVKPDDMVKRLTRVIAYAKKNGLYATAQIYDTFRMPLDFMERLFKSLVFEGGADAIAISDTFANTLPWTGTWMVRKIKSWIPNTTIEIHGHNCYGLSSAYMLGCILGGAEVVHTSVNNLGERTGNASTEEMVMALENLLGIDTGVNLEQIYPTCELVSELTKMPISPTKAITGENIFMQGSGMIAWHQFKLEKLNRKWYMFPFPPAMIGREDKLDVILGVGAGRGIVEHKLEELGIKATRDQMGVIADKVKAEAYLRHNIVPEVMFKEFIKEVMGPDVFKNK
jgi:isopropylmalate/homocitrate/citramalate synthase